MIHFEGPARACASPKAVLIVHHGYGMYGDYFLQFMDQLNLPDVFVWCPQGLRVPELYPGPLAVFPDMVADPGREWFDWGPFFWEHNAGRQHTVKPLDWLTPAWEDLYGRLDEAARLQSLRIQKGLGEFSGPVFVMGFSQGAVLSLHMGLAHLPTAGILAFSGFYLSTRPPALQAPIFLCHGREDPLVPTLWMIQGQQRLHQQGLPVQGEILEGVDHRVTRQGVELARTFIVDRLAQLGVEAA